MEQWSPNDLAQLKARGLTTDEVEAQLATLRVPPPPVRLDRPCTVGDGIERLDPEGSPRLMELGDAAAAAGRVMKFVPASGAATRMFKDLIAARASSRRPSDAPAGRELFERLDDFPFSAELRRAAGLLGRPETEADERAVLDALLDRMRFAELPKALIPFHRADRTRTAFEEHLLEGTRYARATDGTCQFHFTVAPEFRSAFESMVERLAPEIGASRRGATVRVALSEQHASTDTVAIDSWGAIFRASDGTMLFRPAGHGALLRNLEEARGDLVVIKNIDNVLPDEASVEVVRWKRLLIGYLADLQAQVFAWLAACHGKGCPPSVVDEAVAFAATRFNRKAPEGLDLAARRAFVIDALDRPLRVCGVVRNSGEPGGAPFWVHGGDGHTSVQIVESSQVDINHEEQGAIFRRATHFNPVDLVCAVRNWKGEPHVLDRFVDRDTAFVTKKTFEGRDLKALERPGLWNGSMAGWNTVCIEVPESTFAPVKTVFDLLRPQHLHGAAAPAAGERQAEGRVLVIDDQRINQRILEQILGGAGLDVVTASDGERGLEIVRAGGVDLVLLDIVLPGLDGYEVLAQLRLMPQARSVPVVLISSLDEVSDKVRGLEFGAADYVTKPFDQQDVLARVRAQLRIRRLTEELQLVNLQMQQKQELLDEDLRAAADIQRALLPPAETTLGRVTAASVFQPSLDVGGDIFNIIRRPDGTLAFFIADVSGHGVASALLTVSLTQWLSSPAGLGRPAGVWSPATLLKALEQEYPFERFGKYFSILIVILHPESGRFRYSSAGHPAPFIVRSNGEVRHLEAGGPIIGMGFGLPFDEGVDRLDPGDRLVLYTDGVVEDLNAEGERFGLDRLAASFNERRATPIGDACRAVIDEVAQRRGDVPASDDIALLAIELT